MYLTCNFCNRSATNWYMNNNLVFKMHFYLYLIASIQYCAGNDCKVLLCFLLSFVMCFICSLNRLMEAGMPLRLLSNGSSHAPDEVWRRCRNLGLNINRDHIFTPPPVALHLINSLKLRSQFAPQPVIFTQVYINRVNYF